MCGRIARTRVGRNLYSVVVRKPEWKIQPGKSKCRWYNSVKIDLKELMLKGV
jgi:hypothetical protein